MKMEEILKIIISIIMGGVMGNILYRNVDQNLILVSY